MANLTQIQTFIEVARCNSFAQAARRLSLPRSTVTARIKALEERLAVRLFHRTTRQVSLTNEGQSYFSSCEDALEALVQAEEEMSQKEKLTGPIRLSVPIDYPKPELARFLHAFTTQHPGVQIFIEVSDQTVDFISDNFDLALRGRHPGSPGLTARRLGVGMLSLYGLPSLAVPSQTAKLEDFTILDPAKILPPHLQAVTKSHHIVTDSFELTKTLVLEADDNNCKLAAFLPDSLCSEDVASGKLMKLDHRNLIPEIGATPELPVYIVLPSRSQIPRRVRAFIDFLLSRSENRGTPIQEKNTQTS
ncbi:LysR family transcriptional regulator [Kiloniella laminariae]|uniref:LysR family transcriptional regulator n=1 Tax=Kiloniella laminariae TaxID=454162 RepID=A0ABT4LSP4_9PROT|nr:LysR family transcriptional regulator [Kiloniella laminariae]MCZ4282957.1 LysR family transcriptional regulator [Kiloniella laminariae]